MAWTFSAASRLKTIRDGSTKSAKEWLFWKLAMGLTLILAYSAENQGARQRLRREAAGS